MSQSGGQYSNLYNSIISEIYKRDKDGSIRGAIEKYNADLASSRQDQTLQNAGVFRDVLKLLIKLEDGTERLSSFDYKVLETCGVLVSPSDVEENDKYFVAIGSGDIALFGNCQSALSDEFVSKHKEGVDYVKKHFLRSYDAVYIFDTDTNKEEERKTDGGISLLVDIMKLSSEHPHRVFYVPSSRDAYLYGLALATNNFEKRLEDVEPEVREKLDSFEKDEKRVEAMKQLKDNDPQTYEQLIAWLGNSRLQRVHNCRGKKYFLGHTNFNMALYNDASIAGAMFNLRNLFSKDCSSESFRRAKHILSFECGSKEDWPERLPEGNTLIIGGRQYEGINDISRFYDAKIHRVGRGDAYDWNGLRGYENNLYALNIDDKVTVDTLSAEYYDGLEQMCREHIDREKIYQDFIVSKVLQGGTAGYLDVCNGAVPSCFSADDDSIIVDGNYRGCGSRNKDRRQTKRIRYVNSVLLDYVFLCQYASMKLAIPNREDIALSSTVQTLDNLINLSVPANASFDNALESITPLGHAKKIAETMGSNNINDALMVNGCSEGFCDYAKMRYPTINIGNPQKDAPAAVKVYRSGVSS